MGVIQKCITNDGLVMAAFIDSTDIMLEALRIHKCTPVAISAMGRMLTAVSLMGNKLKEEEASVTVRINGGGSMGSIIAVSDSHGNVRGYAQSPGVLMMPDKNGKLDVSGAVGKEGMLSVIKDYGSGQPWSAQVPLVSGEIAEDIAAYYGISEQVPTVLALGVHFDELWRADKAGGLLIQLLPAADEREIVKIEEALKQLPAVSTMMADGLTPCEILTKALAGFEVEFFEPEKVEYQCKCSAARVRRALLTLGLDGIRELENDENGTQIECHFCDKVYHFSKQELHELACVAEASKKQQ